MRLACLTYRPLISGGGETARLKESVTVRGVAERVNYELTGSSPFVHRRVIFSSHEKWNVGVLVDNGQGTSGRAQAVEADDMAIRFLDGVFGGRRDVDWSDQFVATLDKKLCTVVDDTVLPINPSGDGFIKMSKRWVDIKKEMTYADEGFSGSSCWSSATSPLGNVYCLDIYSNRADEDEGEVTVSSQMKFYWAE